MSSGEVMQMVGKAAGIGGIGLGVLLLIFRAVIGKNIFPKLGQFHTYRLITLIVTLTFAIAGTGITAYVYLEKSRAPAIKNGPVPVAPEKAEPRPAISPQAAIQAHLALIDQHRYAQAHAMLSDDSKTRFPLDIFMQVFEAQRAPRGKLLGRKLYRINAVEELPDVPKGHFTIAVYRSDFEHGGPRVEVVVAQAQRGRWKVLFHTLNPCVPEICS